MGHYDEIFEPGFRVAILKVVVAGVFLVILGKIATVMVFSGEYYRGLSSGNRTAEIKIPANRGIIYDRNKTPLTINLPVYLFKKKIISKEEAMLEKEVEVSSARNYPYGPALAHVLSGVEVKNNEWLSGVLGKELVETDAIGKTIRSLGRQEPVSGGDVYLPIDLELQKVLYEQLKNVTGAAVATNPNTGEILALVSTPSFDPEKISDFLDDPKQPLFNRSIAGAYPPGSTFKIITATAGLESGKITEKTTLDDPGILIIGPYKFPNWLYLRNGGTQGVLNVVSALQKSNDIFFYRTGEWTGFDNLTVWAKKFGLGNKLGIDLPGETGGNWPSEVPFLGDLYHLSIGQGDLLVTPLQVNNWTSVIANGGRLCRPHLLGNTDCKDLGISKKTLDLVKQGLVAACSTGGTAWPLFDFKVESLPAGRQVACKTGTAEFGNQNKTHAWLTAFAPVDHPTIAITVLVEGGGEGSDVAAPIVKKVLEEWFKEK